jgi:hypothetical protein
MMLLAEVMLLVSLATLGVFAGANLAEGALLVPYWRSLPAPAFFAWYHANDRRLLAFFAPLTAVTVLCAAAAAAAAFAAGHPGRWLAALGVALVATAAAMFPLYFQGVNARFSAAAIAADDLPAALASWATWHRVREVALIVALIAVLCATLRTGAVASAY